MMPILFAAIRLFPESLIGWTVVGLMVGVWAGGFVKGGRFGLIGDVVVGLTAALIAGWVVGRSTQNTQEGLWGSILVAFLAACVTIALTRAILGGRKL